MHFYNWLLFSFKGRIPRRVYWQFQLFSFALTFLLVLAFGGELVDQITANPEDKEAFQALVDLGWKLNLLLLWPKLAIDVKRIQDRNRPWYWVLIQLIPLVGPIWFLLEAGFLPGTQGPNKFGPPYGQPNNDTPNSGDQGHFEA